MGLKNAVKLMVGFCMPLAFLLGACLENPTLHNCIVILILAAETLLSFVVAIHWRKAVRNRRMLKILPVQGFIWTSSGILFFQSKLSVRITLLFLVFCAISIGFCDADTNDNDNLD